ncbi:hypothetical protein JCGZ_19557 [Jatropha curcas]|uniref:Uncharacterized protein n=1 Tax=Jatropha curcas TaxID=180498 RepID=A0A067K5Y6_JATCU|nr:hypothetical protein JCGZ_19557 [Jatropha curcas]
MKEHSLDRPKLAAALTGVARRSCVKRRRLAVAERARWNSAALSRQGRRRSEGKRKKRRRKEKKKKKKKRGGGGAVAVSVEWRCSAGEGVRG